VEVPELRIVSESIWDAVHARIRYVNEKLGIALQSGFSCAKHVYLFSGPLICGDCGARIIIISGGNNVRYGCPSYRRGVCANRLPIRQTALEEQLIARLEERLTQPAMLDYALARFQEELEKRLAEIQKEAIGVEDLRKERRTLQDKAERLADAVAEAGHSTALLSKLAEVEAGIADLDQRMTPPKTVNIRTFVSRKLLQIRDLLQGDASRAKAALEPLT